MALKDRIPFGMVWVTENTLDHVFCFDAMVVLTDTAAVTTRIRLGVAVVVLPVHHPRSRRAGGDVGLRQ